MLRFAFSMAETTAKNSCIPDAHPVRMPSALPVFLRSFFIQAGWNYERFQNLGFAFAITPALRRIHGSGEKLSAALLRHLAAFNTQPYMAGFVLGNVVRMEENLAGGGADAERKMLEVKAALSSGFAAIGDRVFWGRLKPMTTQLCLMIWLSSGFYGWLLPGADSGPTAAVLFGGPLAGMAVYGAFALYLRWTGLHRGYACGGASSCGFDALNWAGLIRTLSLAGFAFSFLIVAGAFLLLWLRGRPAEAGPLPRIALALGAMALQRAARRLGRSIFSAMAAALAASLAAALLLGPERLRLYL